MFVAVGHPEFGTLLHKGKDGNWKANVVKVVFIDPKDIMYYELCLDDDTGEWFYAFTMKYGKNIRWHLGKEQRFLEMEREIADAMRSRNP
jgi:hypothetical protein